MKCFSIIVLLLIAFFSTIFFTCKKSSCVNRGYSFSIGIKAYPDYDSIDIGDTIFLNLKEPVSLQELNSGNIINYTGAKNLGSVMGIGEMLGSGNERYAIGDFHYQLTKGIEVQSIDPNRFKEYLFTEENGFYLFKLAIIPQKIGIYRLGLSNAANVYTAENPCDRSGFMINFKQTNQHLYFNQWNFGVTPALPNGVYCFKVK